MNKICAKTAFVLVLINLVAIFYLNFAIESNFVAQFVALPWLAIQSIFVLSITSSQQGNSNEC